MSDTAKIRDISPHNIRTLKLAFGTLTTLYQVLVNNGQVIIATDIYLSSETGIYIYRGKVELDKNTSIAFSVGDIVYWDATAEELTTVATGNTKAGMVLEAVLAAATSAVIMLHENRSVSGNEIVAVPINVLTANTTVIQGCLAISKATRIVGIQIAAHVAPIDADGDSTLAITNYDLSATTDDNLLAAATFDLETLTAKNAEALSLTTTLADLILAAGDYVFASLVNSSAAIDTAMVGAVLLFELEI